MSVCWAIALEAHSPFSPHAVPQADVQANEELELLKEEETVSIATRHEQPISQAPSNVYVITDEVNGGEADIYGTEAGIEFLATRWLSGFANLSYQKIGQTFTGVSRRGGPEWKANVGLRGDWDNGLNGEVAVHYVAGATYPLIEFFTALAPVLPTSISPSVASYTLLNLRGGYRFLHNKAEVAVALYNALNDKHKEHPLGDTLGSRVMSWVTLRY